MNLVRRKISTLLANPDNPRTITDSAMAGLQASIERFGLVQPIIFNERTGHVVGGHQRLKALQSNGKKMADIVLVDLSEIEERALNITLNNPAIEGSFVPDSTEEILGLLKDDFEGYDDLNLDGALGLGVDDYGAAAGERFTEGFLDDGPEVDPEEHSGLYAPFPWFGGKRRVAPIIWAALGDVPNYVEPFAGSLAVLLGRPHDPQRETVNDKDAYIANFWRAMRSDPEKVAKWADWPINENDLHARHKWLREQKPNLVERAESDMDFCDPKLAGLWCWGICMWIGGKWCGCTDRRRPKLGHRQGILAKNKKGESMEYAKWLAERMKDVFVACGDWERVCGRVPTTHQGLTGVFFDPPYSMGVRDDSLYTEDQDGIAPRVLKWCEDHGADPQFRIALCGYDGEHNALEGEGWRVYRWRTAGGYATKKTASNADHNRFKERIWFSPHCLTSSPDSATDNPA